MIDAPAAGALEDILVVDLTRALAGPHAAMLLGDLGAEVVKVESPIGDDTRRWGPPFVDPEIGDSESTYFLSCNRNKRSIVLNFKDPADAEVLAQLISRADVLLENFRPGTLDRLGFGSASLAQLNPGLIVLSVSGFGHDGPEGGRAGYDQIAQGEAGLMSVTGSGPDDPQRVGVPITDLLAGIYGAYGVLAALRRRDATGEGQIVRTSLLAAAVGVHAFQGTGWTVGGTIGRARGNHHPSIAPYGLFRCRAGSVQIACGNDAQWRRLCEAFDLEHSDPRLATGSERLQHHAELTELLEAALSGVDADEALRRLAAAGVPAGRVRSLDQVYEWDQTASQGLLIDVEHQTLGRITLPGPPLRTFTLDDTGGETETTRTSHRAPPALGADAAHVHALLTTKQPAGLGPVGAHTHPEKTIRSDEEV